MVGQDPGEANLGSRVFFVWGALCTLCFFYAYLIIPETKGLSLEQVDRMLEETTPRTSAKWVPHETFAHSQGVTEKGTLAPEVVNHIPGHHQISDDGVEITYTNKADAVSSV